MFDQSLEAGYVAAGLPLVFAVQRRLGDGSISGGVVGQMPMDIEFGQPPAQLVPEPGYLVVEFEDAPLQTSHGSRMPRPQGPSPRLPARPLYFWLFA